MIVPIKALQDAVWGMYIHPNINVRSGKLQYIINGPEMHQWHHANDRRVFYANFSTKLALWDWLFGTAFLPSREKPAEYGLYYAYPKDYFLQQIFSVTRIDEDKLAEKSRWFRVYHSSRKRILRWMNNKNKLNGLGVPGDRIPVRDLLDILPEVHERTEAKDH